MKRFFTLFTALVGLLVCHTTKAQQSLAKADSVLLSDRIEGDYVVRRYQVNTLDEADYSIRYRIGNATLDRAFAANNSSLDELADLVKLFGDTLQTVGRVRITGYASPDGPESLNSALAKRRAQNMKNYVDNHYGFSRKYDVELASEIVPWEAVRRVVAASSIPQRDSVLMILDGNHTPAAKQQALKAMPEVWSYLAREVLPPLRRVEVDILYERGRVVEVRNRMTPSRPAPQPAPAPVVVAEQPQPCPSDPCCEELLSRENLGIIVAMPGSDVDF